MAANVAELGWLFDPFTPPPTNTTHLRKVDYTVRDCSWAAAKQLVAAHHYAGKSADITIYRHGLYRRVGNALVGVAIWMPPTKAAALSIDSDWQGVLCLTRLVVGPNEPTNAASYLLGRSMRIIKQDNRFHTLVTYADEAQGHTGAIYRATNWTYCEPTARSLQGDIAYTDSRGRRVSKRSPGGGSYTDAEMLSMGYSRIDASRKHKFIKRLRGGAT